MLWIETVKKRSTEAWPLADYVTMIIFNKQPVHSKTKRSIPYGHYAIKTTFEMDSCIVESVLLHKQTYQYHWSFALLKYGRCFSDSWTRWGRCYSTALGSLALRQRDFLLAMLRGGQTVWGSLCVWHQMSCVCSIISKFCIETADVSSLVLFYLLGGVQFHMIIHR